MASAILRRTQDQAIGYLERLLDLIEPDMAITMREAEEPILYAMKRVSEATSAAEVRLVLTIFENGGSDW